MADPTEPTRYAFEYPDEAGYRDGKGTLSQDQVVLIDEVIDDLHAPAFDFYAVNDEKTGIYEAIVGDDRLVLLAIPVFSEFRKQGIATEQTASSRRDLAELNIGHHPAPARCE